MLWDMNTGRLLSWVPGLPEDAAATSDPPNQVWSYSADLLKVAALAKGEADGPDVIFHCDLARRSVHRISVAGEGPGPCRAVAVRPDGDELAVWVDGQNGTASLQVFDLDKGQTKRRLSTPPLSDVSYLAFSPDGHVLVVGNMEGRLRVLNSTTGALLAESNVSNEPIRAASFLQDRLRILSGQGSSSMTSWGPRSFFSCGTAPSDGPVDADFRGAVIRRMKTRSSLMVRATLAVAALGSGIVPISIGTRSDPNGTWRCCYRPAFLRRKTITRSCSYQH